MLMIASTRSLVIIDHMIKTFHRNDAHAYDPYNNTSQGKKQWQTQRLWSHDGTNGFMDPSQRINQGNDLHDR